MLNQCFGFSSLIDYFATVKARKRLFQVFDYILSNKKSKKLNKPLVSVEVPSLSCILEVLTCIASCYMSVTQFPRQKPATVESHDDTLTGGPDKLSNGISLGLLYAKVNKWYKAVFFAQFSDFPVWSNCLVTKCLFYGFKAYKRVGDAFDLTRAFRAVLR